MDKTLIALLLYCWLPFRLGANMASPFLEGTLAASALSSRDLDVVREAIHIRIHPDFHTADWDVRYQIHNEKAGATIPLLFVALYFDKNFEVWLDGQAIPIRNIPETLQDLRGTDFGVFLPHFDAASKGEFEQSISFDLGEYGNQVLHPNELKYFEAPLSVGEHTIQIKYTARSWTYTGDWVQERSFLYALSPARHWRSFGGLDLTVEYAGPEGVIRIDQQVIGATGGVFQQHFEQLPGDLLEIYRAPQPGLAARALIALQPLGMGILAFLLLGGAHWVALRHFQRQYPQGKAGWRLWLGILTVPLAALLVFICSFDLIKILIGPEAGRPGVYAFFSVFLYPVIMPVYGLVTYLVYLGIKKTTK